MNPQNPESSLRCPLNIDTPAVHTMLNESLTTSRLEHLENMRILFENSSLEINLGERIIKGYIETCRKKMTSILSGFYLRTDK